MTRPAAPPEIDGASPALVWLRGIVPLLVSAAGACGLALYVLGLRTSHQRILAALATALFLGVLDVAGRAAGARPWASVPLGARLAWPASLLLCALPFAARRPLALDGHLVAALALSATLLLVGRVHGRSPTRVPFLATRLRGFGVWELALLAFSIAVAVRYLELGALAAGNIQNDSAYYFGVARHMAITHRFEEPIVWHLVKPPATLVHAPFDYWGGLTCLVLAPILAVFGPTQHTAFIAMAGISGLSVVAFWYLVCVAMPVRYPVLQLLALVAFAFVPSASLYRFDTESLPLYQLLVVIVLAALAQGRHRLAVVAAFLLCLTRVDGFILFLGTTLLIAYRLRARRQELRSVLLPALGLLAAYWARNLWSFGALMPPGSSAGALMRDQGHLYVLHLVGDRPGQVLLERLSFASLAERFNALVDNLHSLAMLPAQEVWYLLVIAATLLPGRRPLKALVPATAFLLAFFFVWASGPMYHGWRTLSGLLPLLVMACIISAALLLDGAAAATRRVGRRFRLASSVILTVLVAWIVYPMALRIQPYESRGSAPMRSKEIELGRLDALFAGKPLASATPWYVMANTNSPVVSLPNDGADAAAEIIHRYSIEWLVYVDGLGGLRAQLGTVPVGGQKFLGDVLVERVPTTGTITLFRVIR